MQFHRIERIPALTAPLLAAVLAASPASAKAVGNPDAAAAGPSYADTARIGPDRDSAIGGTGLGPIPGLGGSSRDSLGGRDTLWSDPYGPPATPGSGLPNSPGSGWPGTGTPGLPGNGGSGTGGSGMGADSSGIDRAMPRDPEGSGDSIGAPDWLERG